MDQTIRTAAAQRTPQPAARLARTSWLKTAAPPLVVLLIVVAAWQIYVSVSGVPEYLVPGPGAVANRILADPAYFYREGLITLSEALLGLALGAT
ncbi:MAG: hypothetical protein ACRDJE_28445, partial [Dehalococcoidia bacterium]